MRTLSFCIILVVLASSPLVQANVVPDGAVTINTKFPGGNARITENKGNRVIIEPDLRGDNPWFYWYLEAVAQKPGRQKNDPKSCRREDHSQSVRPKPVSFDREMKTQLICHLYVEKMQVVALGLTKTLSP